jgi:DNA-binding Lrp family transcriptional regulator
MTLDSADKKILLSLINNSRSPVSVIAKETHLSREIVNYRMSKLEQEGIITGYIARINQPLFCSGVALMTCKIIRSNVQRFKEIISFIQKHPSINWCIETCGMYDLQLTILYDTPQDLANTVTDISNFIGNNLKEHDISLYIDEYKFDRSGLITGKEQPYIKHKTVTFNKDKKIDLDSIDIALIAILSKDCRTKNIDMSKDLKISEDTVRLRIKNSEKKGIIAGYTLSISEEKLGFEAYQIGVKIEQMTDQAINKIKYYALTNPYLVFCVRTSGKYNIIMNIHAKNRQHFNEIMLDIRSNLPEIIDYQFELNMKTHKEVFVPEEKIGNK